MDTHKRLPLKRLTIMACIAILFSCNSKPRLIDVDPEFSKYIDAYTSGVVSKKNAIRIQLASDASVTHTVNETIKESLFDLSPSVPGKAYWVDARTIEFKPDKDLSTDALYTVSFKLGKVADVSSKFSNFHFNIQTLKPSFQVNESGLKSNGKETMSFSGQLLTADMEESVAVEKMLSAKYNDNSIKINWQHNEAARTHDFTITGIKRMNAAGKLIVSWDGKAINSNITGNDETDVPALGDFVVLNAKAIQEEEQYALVQFSDPITPGQILDGLITISEQEDLSYTILGSEVKIYASNKLDGDYTMNIHTGIQNQWGEKLQKQFTANVFFENRMPSVKIQGKGVILPASGGKLLLPFEAVNLKAIDVSIIKIYENNIAQFLQSNDLNGDENLRRVSKPMVQATVRLDNDKGMNLHRKNRFSLDLDKYIKTEPGAIYRVNIGFRPDYSVYTCDSLAKDDEDDYDNYYYREASMEVDDDADFWSRYDDYYPYGYNWEERENPCHQSYYNKERFDSRNILASNIGLTAKKGNDNSLFVAVNSIITTEPMSGVELQVMDYQQQIIAKGNSNNDGIANLELKRKPYLLIAKKGNEKGYLKLDDGNSLPLSRFDVSGVEVKNGIKGYIFGERGVWRPGDSLFLSFITEDTDKKLPADHPVEMELISPRGQLYKRVVQTLSAEHFNVFRTATDADAPTGNWLCKIKVGGAVFEKRLKIETVMPNRLKIDLNFGNAEALGRNSAMNGALSAKWLFGATAQNLKAKVDAQLYKKSTGFPNFKEYVFDNPTAYFPGTSTTIFDGALSAEGTAVINPSFSITEEAPGQLLANIMVRVFEPGGNFSIDNFSMPYNPYSSYVGVHVPEGDKTWGYLQSGKSHRFDIADVDTKGKPVSGITPVEVQLYKIQWRWWWDNSGNDMSNFTQDSYNKIIQKDTVSVSNGKGLYNVKIDDDWGRYLILIKDLRSGHTTGSVFYVDDYGWQTRGGDNDATAAAMLSFTSDKTIYNVGDDITITIPTSKDGRALISIENGSHVIKTEWKNTEQGQTKYSFKATADMSPNIFANVSLVQPHAQTVNDLPIRMYGVIPITVEDKNTLLKPQIKMADEIRPQQANTITVSEASGKKMNYVIAVVDEGLLDLTRYKTPDPHHAFFAKEALGVKSWDLYDQVIGAFGSQIERILTIGGDGEAELASKTRKANRFLPVVQFMGPYSYTGESKSHRFTLPSYMGSVKVMVIAAGDHAYGSAEKSVKVKKPVMLLTTMPRVLGPGEELKIPVTVFATDNNIKNVSLSLQSNPFIESGGTQNVSFSGIGEKLVYFTAKVKPNTGIGKIKITASSGKEQDVSEIEIDIRNPNPPVTQVSETVLQPGKSWSNTIAMIGDAGTSNATIEISSIPAINLQKRLSYLIQYPHGCIEQTTSSVFPQLVLNSLMDLNDAQKQRIEKNIRAGIQKLQNFQTTDGGFSYWPGNTYSDEWGSSYAGHFLLEASAAGYNVPTNMIQQWKQYERLKANAWNVTTAPWYGTDLQQAYRLYLLALSKSPELGAMNRLKEFKFISPEAKWRLAAAYHLAGQTQIALKMISGLPTAFSTRPAPGITYGSDLRDQAMVLEALTIMNRKTEAAQIVKSVAAKIAEENWYSTQTTAYSLIAVAKFSGTDKSAQKINAIASINGKSTTVNSETVLSQVAVAWQNNKSNVQVTNKGNNVLYVRTINEGQPISGDSVSIKNNAAILQVSATYMNANGNTVDISNIKQGTDFVAKVAIKNPGNRNSYTQMALSQIFPSGWEILNTRLYNSEGTFKSSPSDYMDIRDDRVYHYFNLRPQETLTFYVQLNAAYPGHYYWPGVYCEAMYDHTISGGINGKWINVTE